MNVKHTLNLKRAIVAVVVMIIGIGNVLAQSPGWTDDGTTVRLTTSSDAVGIGTTSPYNKVDISGNLGLRDNDLILRGTGGQDLNHGVGWYGTGKLWNGINVDGPVVYGYSSGILGTNQSGTRSNILYWNSSSVGIGTQSPSSTLDIHGGKVVIESNSGSCGQLQILNTSDDEVSMVFVSNVTGGQGGSVTTSNTNCFWGIGAGCYGQGRDLFGITSAAVGGYAMAVKSNGNVGIGITNPSSRLAVNGTIRAKEVIVTTQGWPDHVFKPDYNLKPLHEVEKYIKKNSHLEGIPSEKEVMAKGVPMGEMQAKLLQKLEETTLYLIEMKKENEDLKARLSAIEQKVR